MLRVKCNTLKTYWFILVNPFQFNNTSGGSGWVNYMHFKKILNKIMT